MDLFFQRLCICVWGSQWRKYDLLGSFKLQLLLLEADDVFANKTLATEETARGAMLPL